MLHLIREFTDRFVNFLSEDPVRATIPVEQRIGNNRDVFVLRENDAALAITCVSYQSTIPESERELFEVCDNACVAVFYTIWSYKPGAGRQLLLDSAKYITENNPNIVRLVTLSPKTEMARRFHLKNGALVYRENEETVNYEYVRSGRLMINNCGMEQ